MQMTKESSSGWQARVDRNGKGLKDSMMGGIDRRALLNSYRERIINSVLKQGSKAER